MAACRATRSVVCRPPLALVRRAAWMLAGLVLVMAAPGRAFVPAALADVGPGDFATGAIPSGGYLLSWQDVRRSDFALTMQRLTAAGQPAGAAKLLDVGSPHLQLVASSVAVSAAGLWAVFWVEPAGADQVGVGAAFFDARDKLLARMSYPDPVPDPGGLIISYHPIAVALTGGGFVVAFESGTQDDPTADPLRPTRSDIYVMKLDATGKQLGAAVRVNQETTGFQHLTGVGATGSHVVVSWDSIPGGPETSAVRARFLDGNLVPAGPEVHVAESGGSPFGTGASRLAVGADGGALLAWQGVEAGAGGGPASAGVRMRAFGPSGSPIGAEHAADPGTPGDHGFADMGLTTEGTVWVSWSTLGAIAPSGDVYETILSLRPFDLAGRPMAGAEDVGLTTVDAGPFLTGGRGGALVAWRPSPSSTLLEGFVVGTAGGQSGPPSAPFAIDSPALPAFRAWVRFSPADTAPFWGTPVDTCLAQALCAAGVITTRAELIARVIGPRPNGFLWPQIVHFTTDPTEVWLQEKTTGATRYYLLPEGSPGTDTLTGLFDRHGFMP